MIHKTAKVTSPVSVESTPPKRVSNTKNYRLFKPRIPSFMRPETIALLSCFAACFLICVLFLSPNKRSESHSPIPKAEVPSTFSVAPTADSPLSQSPFCEPIPAWSSHTTSLFGGRDNPLDTAQSENHKGVDIAMPTGTEIYAVQRGEVILAEDNGNGYGKHVVIAHDDVLTTLYGHCSELLVKAGDIVTQGQVIAKVGSTGKSTGNHLHFEVRENRKPVDPTPFLPS